MKTRILDLFAVFLTRIVPVLLLLLALHEMRELLLASTRQNTLLPAWVTLLAGLNRARGFAFVLGFVAVLYAFQQHRLREAREAQLKEELRVLRHSLDEAGTP